MSIAVHPGQRAALRAIVLALLAGAALVPRAVGQDVPIFERIPFDQVTLNAANDGAVLQVKPIAFPMRRVPEELPTSGSLRIALVDRPGRQFDISYQSIVKIETFEDLVLSEAVANAKAGRGEDAFEGFAYLFKAAPKLPGLDDAFHAFLLDEARAKLDAEDYLTAMARLRTTAERRPNDPAASRLWGQVLDQLADRRFANDDYAGVRTLIDGTRDLFPQHASAETWEKRLIVLAESERAKAIAAMDAEQWPEAHAACRVARRAWPTLPGLAETVAEVERRYPRVVVAAHGASRTVAPRSLTSWPSRRAHALVRRSLVELTGPAVEGGDYQPRLGQLEVADAGREILLTLAPNLRWRDAPDRVMTAADVAMALRAYSASADPTSNRFVHELGDGVAVQGVNRLSIRLPMANVLPQAFLAIDIPPRPLPTFADADDDRPAADDDIEAHVNGPYYLAETSEDGRVFRRNETFPPADAGAPLEIVERDFEHGRDAIAALRDERIDVIERVNPWDVPELRDDPDIAVESFKLPLVHVLVPNMQRPLTARRDFRRALVYSIDREGILEAITGKTHGAGDQVVSGPFMAGLTYDDALGYAYNGSVKPRAYNPILGAALAEIAKSDALEPRESSEQDDATPDDATPDDETPDGPHPQMDELVLAHPAHDIARLACAAIQRQLELVGLRVRLLEHPVGLAEMPPEADLWYVELAPWEPLADVHRIVGPHGLSGDASPYIDLALRRLASATQWSEVGRLLRDIHETAHHEVVVIPLWQLTDYTAHRRSMHGAPSRPLTLYDGVDQWRIQRETE